MKLRRGTVPVTLPGPFTSRQVAAGVRVLLLLLVFVLAIVGPRRTDSLTWFPLLVAVGLVASARPWTGLSARLLSVVEAVAVVVAVLESGAGTSGLFPYLLAPAFAGGLAAGLAGTLVPSGFAALALVVAGVVAERDDAYSIASAEWVVLALVSGIAAAWVRTLVTPPPSQPAEVDTSYAAAYRLLAQLRPVARQLSVGLDPVTIAEGLLQAMREVVGFDRGAIFVRTGGGRMIPLAHLGTERPGWEVDIGGEGPFAEAWLSQREQRLGRQLTGEQGSALVVPLVIGLRTFGLIGLECGGRELAAVDTSAMASVVAEAALRLETALLFDEVRGMATAEERRRLAREIHDGIAQELSYLGYVVDSLTADARQPDSDLTPQLQQLRHEITRIVSELRLSIFDLRSEVDAHGGLGAALSEYVRSVGRQSGLTVHMSLAEAANRLPAETEAELLRIAQEAITNARKHAEAENLWVTLAVEPPAAVLRIEDDGRGLGKARSDSYGLQIMRERARRLRTTVAVEPRQPRGTLVEVRLGGADRANLAGSVATGREDLEEMPRR